MLTLALGFFAVFLLLPCLPYSSRRMLQRAGPSTLRRLVEARCRCRHPRSPLLTAAIAVPLNLVFGVAAAWAITKFDFPGKTAC